ncbi:MAG: FAD-binding domain-containing protein [Cyclobacteriaceae bacterium]|nr:FAD-binding domain-containing protein [Cyclobacteriaceae bacterium]
MSLPELRNCPAEYIHEPWHMPPIIQHFEGLLIGEHYPYPIVDLNKTYKAAQEQLWSIRKLAITKKESERILKMHTIPKKSR